MKLSIEKLTNDNMKVEVVVDAAKKPVSVVLTPQEIDRIIKILEQAKSASKFLFSWEI